MSLTPHGERLLAKAEHALAAHQDLLGEATRIKGRLTGKLRLGAGASSSSEVVGRVLAALAQRLPEVEVTVKHGTSLDTLAAVRGGALDAGLYHEAGDDDPALVAIELARFGVDVVARPGLVAESVRGDWAALAELPWIYPTASACCSRAAESVFKHHRFRPARVIGVDREDVTRSLVASGVGVGLLHAPTTQIAVARGEVEALFATPTNVRVVFAYLATRAADPIVAALAEIARASVL